MTIGPAPGKIRIFREWAMSRKTSLPDLEKSLDEINTLIEKMEHGDLTLEQSLTQFERGIVLIKHAQTILQEAEQKVQILLKNHANGEDKLQDYETDTE
jgi:exodeoxyribonuclease VII small subunit